MLNTGDLLADVDLLALDGTVLDEFGTLSAVYSGDKRRIAVEHWLTTRVQQAGYVTSRHQTRRQPDSAFGLTGGSYADIAQAASDHASDLWLSSLLPTPSTDAIYVGLDDPWRGLWVGMLDSVNVNTLTASSVTYWDGGQWAGFNSLTDATMAASSIALSGGGRLMWQAPDDWARRPVNDSRWLYWVRVKLTRAPSASAVATSLLPIRRSRLTVPGAMYALGLLYREAAARTRGDWADKARAMLDAATSELSIVMPQIADEFDADDSGAVGATEAGSVTPSQGFQWLRG